MVQNKTRGSFLQYFQKIIGDYNSNSISIDEAYETLVKQAEAINKEQQRDA